MLIDHRLCTVSTQQEPLHTHSSVCGHEELFKAPVCSLANCFEGFTIHKGNCYLMSFHNIGRDLETKSVYSKQGNRPHPLPSHPVCLQTDQYHRLHNPCFFYINQQSASNSPFLFLLKACSSITSSWELPVSVIINFTSWHALKFHFHSVIFRY